MMVIFMGSFYLVNVILAIVAMAYKDCSARSAKEEADSDKIDKQDATIEQNNGGVVETGKPISTAKWVFIIWH